MADEAGRDATGRALVLAADAAFATEMQRELQRLSLEAQVRPTADEALAEIERTGERFALAILDSSLPTPELFRVYQRLRAAEAATSTPVVFSRSALAAAQGSEGGADTYLGTTATPREVAESARGLLPDRPEPAGRAAEQRPASATEVRPEAGEEPSGSSMRTVLLGVLLGILLGIAILALIWGGRLPLTLPRLTPLLGG